MISLTELYAPTESATERVADLMSADDLGTVDLYALVAATGVTFPDRAAETAEFQIDRKRLLSALKTAKKAAPKRSVKPILDYARIEINGAVDIVTTDLERRLTQRLETDHVGSAAVCVPIGRTTAIVSKLKTDVVTFRADRPRGDWEGYLNLSRDLADAKVGIYERKARELHASTVMRYCEAVEGEPEDPENECVGEIIGYRLESTERLAEILADQNQSDMTARILAGSGEFTLPTGDESEFPPGADFVAETVCVVPAPELARLIRQTIYATDDTSTRYALGGVMVEFERAKDASRVDVLRFVATDSRRLAVATASATVADFADVADIVASWSDSEIVKACEEYDVNGWKDCRPEKRPNEKDETYLDRFRAAAADFLRNGFPRTESAVVPTAALANVAELLKGETADVEIALHRTGARFGFAGAEDSFSVETRLIEGRFPKWRDVVPLSEFKYGLEMAADVFREALETAMVCSSEENRGIDFSSSPQIPDVLVVETGNDDVGRAKIEVRALRCGRNPAADIPLVTFDPRFILEYVKLQPKTATVTLELIDDVSAGMLRNSEDETFCIIMPLSPERR